MKNLRAGAWCPERFVISENPLLDAFGSERLAADHFSGSSNRSATRLFSFQCKQTGNASSPKFFRHVTYFTDLTAEQGDNYDRNQGLFA